MILTFSPGLAGLSSRGVGGSEGDSEAGGSGAGRPRRRSVLGIEMREKSGRRKYSCHRMSRPREARVDTGGERRSTELGALRSAVPSTRPPGSTLYRNPNGECDRSSSSEVE